MTKDCSWNYHENYKRRTWAKHGQNIFCACSFHGNSMNNLFSYCWLINAKIRASDKDLPVPTHQFHSFHAHLSAAYKFEGVIMKKKLYVRAHP